METLLEIGKNQCSFDTQKLHYVLANTLFLYKEQFLAYLNP